MLREFNKLCKEKTLCEIYTDAADTNTFGVGLILACDEEFYILNCVDKYGFYDGVTCALIADVYRISTDTVYLKEISKLADYNKVSLEDKTSYCDNLIIGFLNRIKNEKRICAIELCESDCDDVYGHITEVDSTQEIIKIATVDSHGQNDGITVIDIKSVSEVYYRTRYTERLEALNGQEQ